MRQEEEGMLYVVGIGPGGALYRTKEAQQALEESGCIAGYTVYAELIREEFPGKEWYTTPMTKERERCIWALEQAAAGKTTAVICSGDAGVYGMASLVLELAEAYPGVEVRVIAGVSAAFAGGALLGAPLSHDFAVISLSDRLTEWEVIGKRLRAAARAGFPIALYNPGGRARADYLRKACDILLEDLSGDTVCGVAEQIGREGECEKILTLRELRVLVPNMFMTVFIGNSTTRVIGDRMVTPRGYRL